MALKLAEEALKVPAVKELVEASKTQPMLVVFLRHKGCTFCRETASRLAEQQDSIRARGIKLSVVHMSAPEVGEEFLRSYGLRDFVAISDPGQEVYRAFGVKRGSLNQVLGPKVWLKGFVAGVLEGHGIGGLDGDGFQLPGAVLLKDGEVVEFFQAESAGDEIPVAQLCGIG